jgi:hypothetical protein
VVWGHRIAPRAFRGVPLTAVPDKRQNSKQRRAARNRASRDALAARRTNAVTAATASASSRTSSAGSATTGSVTGASASAGRGGFGGLLGARGNRRPGDLAVVAALGLALVSAVSVLFFTRVPVDDRGEPLPQSFKGVAESAREAITGQPLPDEKTSLVDAFGPGILLPIALPVVVAGFAFWANRRPNRARLLMYAMVGMAVVVLFAGVIGQYFFPSLIALAIATYQVRKADMPARAAERAAPTRGRRGVIDAESEEVEDERDDAGPDPDGAGDEAGSGAGNDPLAELEAELEAEERAGGGGGDRGRSRGTTPEG